jgi:hypothetical protein
LTGFDGKLSLTGVDGSYFKLANGNWANSDGTRIIVIGESSTDGCFGKNNVPSQSCYPHHRFGHWNSNVSIPAEGLYDWSEIAFGDSSGVIECRGMSF